MMPEQQQRILGYFIEEAKDHLNTIEQGLLNLQATIEDHEMVNEVFRAAHSVKGGAAMLGIESVQQTSHRLEDYFKILKESPVQTDRTLESMFLQVFDGLQSLIEELQGPFGLTDDKAQEVMADIEPVFGQLEQHLNTLVAQSAGAPAAPPPLAAAPRASSRPHSEESALKLVFRSDVPAHLRDMLSLFKQADTPESRQTLQESCEALLRIGEQFELSAWCLLLQAVRAAVGNPQQTYRALAPIVIKDLKQAQELVLSGQEPQVLVSDALQAMVPEPVAIAADTSDDIDALLDDALSATEEPDFEELLTSSMTEAQLTGSGDLDLDWLAPPATESRAEESVNLGLDLGAALEATSQPGLGDEFPPQEPEVGTAELNSLADLFEGEMSSLSTPWQDAEQSDGENDAGLLDIEISDDFSDLLAEEGGTDQGDDRTQADLVGLFGDMGIDTDMTAPETNPAAASNDDFADLFDVASDAPSHESSSDADLDALLDSVPAAEATPPINSASEDASESVVEAGILNDLGDLFGDSEEADASAELGTDLDLDSDLAFLDQGAAESEDLDDLNFNSDEAIAPEADFDLGFDLEMGDAEESVDLDLGFSTDVDAAAANTDSRLTEEVSFEAAIADDSAITPEGNADFDDLFGGSEDTAEHEGDGDLDLGLVFESDEALDFSDTDLEASATQDDDLDFGDLDLEGSLEESPTEVNDDLDLSLGTDPSPAIAADELLDDLWNEGTMATSPAIAAATEPAALPDLDDPWEEEAVGSDEDALSALDSLWDGQPESGEDAATADADDEFGDFEALDFSETDAATPESAIATTSEEADLFDADPIGQSSTETSPSADLDDLFGDDPLSDNAAPGNTAQTDDLDTDDFFNLESPDSPSAVAEVEDLDELADEAVTASSAPAAAAPEWSETSAEAEDLDLGDLLLDAEPEQASSSDLGFEGLDMDIDTAEPEMATSEFDALHLDVPEAVTPEASVFDDLHLDADSTESVSVETDDLGELDFDALGLIDDSAEASAAGEDLDFDGLGLSDDEVVESGSPGEAIAAFGEDLDDLLADTTGSGDITASMDDLLEESPASSEDDAAAFDDLDALLTDEGADVTPEATADNDESDFDDLDALLTDDRAEDSGDEEDGGFDDLDALLAEPESAAAIATPSPEAGVDFDELDALLEDEASEVDAEASDMSSGEFDDLERLLEEADQTLGGSSPTIRAGSGSTRSTRRVSAMVDQTMRVSVKHLDTLSNLVGELVVNRNSLEQDQERLRQFLDNLLFQVQQLNDVGQRMRDLYERSLLESSLISSRQAFHGSGMARSGEGNGGSSHATGATFDALEMDRFTGFHTLSQEMIELIVRVRESASDIGYTVDSSENITRQFRQVTTQLQEGLNKARMVPFAQTVDRLPRAVRDISLKCGKEARLVVEGRDTLIDKMILERLFDPMTHLVNNAITHGVETPEERVASGKPREGTITVRAFYQGNQTVIYIADDGAGINPDLVKQKAIKKGLITQAEARSMTVLDTYELLFRPGFSTRDKADDFAGRGVGMDVVRTALSEIRGSITIDSEMGRGTSFTIRLPLTLSISKALSCLNNQARIAFPMDGVEDMFDVPKDRVQVDNAGHMSIVWRDSMLPFQPLSDLLQFNRTLGRGRVYGGSQDEDMVSIVVLRSANTHIGVQVDRVLGEQEIVIKQLEGPVPKPIGIAGATVLGDGRVMPIADVLELIDIAQGRVRREGGASLWSQTEEPPVETAAPIKTEPTVLIVDDSITVRELLSMSFNKVGYRVEQARDGQEAWEKLRSGLPCDLVFCDIEMPRMDGLELLSRMQKDGTLKKIPIAMLTSRGADRHRQMALDLGASGYFTKPYLEEALLDAAQRMLGGEVLLTKAGGASESD